LIKNPHESDVNLATSTARDVSVSFKNLQRVGSSTVRVHSHPRRPHECVLWGRKNEAYMPTRKELGDLRMKDINVGLLDVTEFKIAYILNAHFKAGR